MHLFGTSHPVTTDVDISSQAFWDLPFGGHKWSGIGLENGRRGLYGFTETQVLTGPRR